MIHCEISESFLLQNGETALMKAATGGHREIIALLLEFKAEVNDAEKVQSAGCTAAADNKS